MPDCNTVQIGIRAVSLTNQREHWAKRAKRAKEHRAAAHYQMRAHRVKCELPCVITLTRLAPRPLDDDNLRGALKSVRDGIADWAGVDDRDPAIKWEYGQGKAEKGAPSYGVLVSIRGMNNDPSSDLP